MEASVAAHIVVFVTAGSADEGHTIGRALVDERLAACVNIIPSVESLYRWQGHVHRDQEVLLVAKTTAAGLERLAKRVKQLHSYDTPEIIALPIVAGASDYLRWIDEETQPSGPPTQTIEARTDSE
jgi:periplasmic divalent cation tolerance protein